ncbi:MAG TPA: ABC transporter permease [Gallionella sp.]|nr:ABC transporter permease [Gallionella sp.]
MRAVVFVFLTLFCGAALAHEIRVDTTQQAATVIRLTYADGRPFTFEAYELYLPGKDIPEQVGRTNAQGQIIFLSGNQTEWRIKAFSADGHGVDQQMKLAAPSAGSTSTLNASAEPPRALLLAAGLGVLFGVFGLVQLSMRRKQT